MKKKYLCAIGVLLFALSFVFCCQTGKAAEYKNYGDNYEWIGWIQDDGDFALCGCNGVSSYVNGTLEIPSYIEGHKVTYICGMGYSDFSIMSPELVNKLIIPETVEDMDAPFRNLFPNLKSLTVLSSEEDVIEDLFYGLGDEYISKLQELTIANSEELDDSLEDCSGLTILTVLGSDHGYVELDLTGTNVQTLSLPTDITGLELTGFLETSLTIPSSLFSLYLHKCPNLSTLNCGKSIQKINICAADGCPKLTIGVTISSNNQYGALRSRCFSGSGITSITIDDSELGYSYKKDWFYGMKNLKSITVTNPSGYGYYSVDGVLYWSIDKKKYNNDDLLCYPGGKSKKGNYTMPKWCKCYYKYAFADCVFTTITVPENVTGEFYWDGTEWNGFDKEYKKTIIPYCSAKFRVLEYSDAIGGGAIKKMYKAVRSHFQAYKGKTYSIKYELNGGKNNKKNVTKYRAGDKPFYPYPAKMKKKKKNYVFYGWKCSHGNVEFGNRTYTAVWGKKVDKVQGVKGKANQKKKSISLVWKKMKGVNHYAIYWASYDWNKKKNKSKGCSCTSANKNKVVLKGLDKGVCYIRVKAYKKKKGVELEGKESKLLKIKIK